MNKSAKLRKWAGVLEQGYDSLREITPRYVAFYFPSTPAASSWIETRRGLEHAEAAFTALLAALRLHKSAYVSSRGSYGIESTLSTPEIESILAARQEHVSTPVIPMLAEGPYFRRREPRYALRFDDFDPVGKTATGIIPALNTRLSLALRRFLASRDKEGADRFIDLLVALEVLFGDQDPAAAGHKISFRAATVVGSNPICRDRIFSLLKKAYGSRSAILHGRTSNRIDNEPEDVDEVELIARRSLTWFLDQLTSTGRVLEGRDIDKICFASTPLQSQLGAT